MEFSIESSIGNVRQSNQDYAGCFVNQDGHRLLVLCDGMGGHNGGDVASQMAVNQLGHSWENDWVDSIQEGQEWIQQHYQIENERIYQASLEYDDLKGMGTTIVTAMFIGDQVFVSNIGDSRAYLDDGESLQLLTEDHTFVNELVKKGEITPEEAANHPQKNALMQSLGVSQRLKPHGEKVELLGGQQLLLVTDGLYGALTEREMLDVLHQEDLSLQERCQHLVRKALKNDGRDNITICLARKKNEGEVESCNTVNI